LENTENKETILVIDDTPVNLEILVKMFQKNGYRVKAATSGQMGIRAAENDPPDIVLLDVTMPEMNGYEVCRKMKQTDLLKNIPVIFISALTETFDKVAAFESGGVDYITKPIQIEEALARVRTHLALRKYQHLLETKNKDLREAMTLLKETQGQLVNSEKMASLGVLTAGIAHEINNPISFIYSSSLGLSKNIRFFREIQKKYEEILYQMDGKNLKEIKQYKSDHDFSERLNELSLLTDNIIDGAKRISGIVQSLRLFARVDEADMKPINIPESIDSALLLLQHKISDRIKIIKEYKAIPPMACYPARISQVFMNILSNAIDAIESKTEGTGEDHIIIKTDVKTDKGSSYVTVEIRDSGSGVPEEIIKNVFDPFYTTKPVGKGLGLGLSISNNIIREHGGKIEINNNEEDGASFKIFLPVNS